MYGVRALAEKARLASARLALTSSDERNRALRLMAEALLAREDEILAANAADMAAARDRGVEAGLLDRLELTPARMKEMADALLAVALLADPLGEVVSGHTLPNGIELRQVRVPLGVVAIIYEARPNVTADAAGLCVKTGNAVILRGGSLAIRSNMKLVDVLAEAAELAGLPEGCVALVSSTDHAAADELMSLHGLIDVLIPRGGAGLIKSCVENSKVPVIETGTGNCHVYVHSAADAAMAQRIVINAKCQRPSVCNAAESLLFDEEIYVAVAPAILDDLLAHGVTLYADERIRALGVSAAIEAATEEDWGTEYHELKMSVKVVSGLDEAIAHINRYGTKHSEAIVTADYAAARRFLTEVDAAAVYVNASTRFTDGAEFGLGAEIGISTQKLHARGPMGLAALTSTKHLLMGDGQIR
ncbi:MAG: glutamate-5-semialdehyde dehydrogenase [Coriobacteriia bacterium]|nr:glutamate-5-semialdehyde dehydrogenase [Coriobacteriia bacterium]